MQTVKVFKLGKAQAVRIPARFRFDVDEVQVFRRGDELVLRAKPRDAAEFFAWLRAKYGPIDILPVPRSKELEPIEPLEL
ncbi:MAG: AbrB/MazE/SpoVT family DNA-binding domain-containing protein [Rudaea sp.]|uniref:antitoxin n=1 Tax=Rudaea sp. TaxID=2136325 RepID=UPI0039E3AB3F